MRCPNSGRTDLRTNGLTIEKELCHSERSESGDEESSKHRVIQGWKALTTAVCEEFIVAASISRSEDSRRTELRKNNRKTKGEFSSSESQLPTLKRK